MDPKAYPTADQLAEATKGFNIIEVDVLGKALEIGDASGRSANVVMMGALSKTPAFAAIPGSLWLEAVKGVSPTPAIWAANYKAFAEGQTLI
jgi:indolepyruvate ferredoxin oxidoreductase alpha subunit